MENANFHILVILNSVHSGDCKFCKFWRLHILDIANVYVIASASRARRAWRLHILEIAGAPYSSDSKFCTFWRLHILEIAGFHILVILNYVQFGNCKFCIF